MWSDTDLLKDTHLSEKCHSSTVDGVAAKRYVRMCHCPQRDPLGEMGLTGTGMVESPSSTSLLYCFFIFFFLSQIINCF